MSNNIFYHKFKNKSDDELKSIVKESGARVPNAILAAKQLLSERGYTENDEHNAVKEITENPISKSDVEFISVFSNYDKPIKANYSLRAIASYLLIIGLYNSQIFKAFFHVDFSRVFIIPAILLSIFLITTLSASILIFKKRYNGLIFGLISFLMMMPEVVFKSYTYVNRGFFTIILQVYESIGIGYSFLNAGFFYQKEESISSTIINLDLISIFGIWLMLNAIMSYNEKNEWPEHLN